MALINRLGGGSGGIRPAGVRTDRWSQNSLALGQFVTLGTRETTLSSGTVYKTSDDRTQPGLMGHGRFDRSPDGAVVWNLAGETCTQLRLERLDSSGGFVYTTLARSAESEEAETVTGTLLAISADLALVMEGSGYRYTGFKLVRHSGGKLTLAASGSCTDHPARPDWIALPGPDENSFFYLSRDRYLMKGTVAGSAISFSVADGSSYRNKEQLYHATEEGYNKLYGGKLADGNLLICWNRVNQILDSGEEEEEDPDLGTLYWPYETYTYDLMVSLLDPNGVQLDTVTLAQSIGGSRSTLFAAPLAAPLVLADGRALLQLNLQNNQLSGGRAAKLVTVTGGKLTLTDAPAEFLQSTRWERLAAVGSDSILARVTAWGDTGVRSKDRFRPQLTYYRLSGDTLTALYSADCLGDAQSAGYEGSFYWTAEWSAAGHILVFGGRWSPRRDYLCRLVARWESGYRPGTAGEQYAGLCGRPSGADGYFGLIAPGNT